jgi:hypothetical protein
MADESKADKLKRLLSKRTEAARKKIKLIKNLTTSAYRCDEQKEMIMKALGYLESDVQEIKDKLEKQRGGKGDLAVDL